MKRWLPSKRWLLTKRWFVLLGPPFGLALLVAAIWQLLVEVREIPPFLLPAPSRVAGALWEHAGELMRAARFTAAAALCGLAASALVGISVAILFSQSTMIRRSSYPYAIYLQTAPIVAIAPLLATWIGEGFVAIVVVVFIISLFPIITSSTDGLLRVPPELREYFQLHQATRWQKLWYLQLPHAAPQILTGLKTSSAMVVLGATVGEYFVGSLGEAEFGLGHVIFKSIPLLQIDKLFATTIVCTTLSVTIFYSISALGDYCVFWQDGDGRGSEHVS